MTALKNQIVAIAAALTIVSIVFALWFYSECPTPRSAAVYGEVIEDLSSSLQSLTRENKLMATQLEAERKKSDELYLKYLAALEPTTDDARKVPIADACVLASCKAKDAEQAQTQYREVKFGIPLALPPEMQRTVDETNSLVE